MSDRRVFSGVQPTGELHLGNYLGAIRNFATLGETHSCLYCIVDMHAITTYQDPELLAQNTREVTAAYLAAGIDPVRQIIFNQSRVAAHAELAWILNCVARIGWMNRMTQFKEKAGSNRENASVGLYTYPVLMAADILAYRATHVPVGEDQKQHLELSRDIAQKFNNDFNADEFFPLPEPLIMGAATRVMSLRDGTKKMSKSDTSAMSRITLTDSADDIARKIRKAKTDPEPLPDSIDGLETRPEAANLVNIYAALANETVEETLTRFGGATFAVFKEDLAERAIEVLAPINDTMTRLMADTGHIDAVLEDGTQRAQAIAGPVLEQVRKYVGFLG